MILGTFTKTARHPAAPSAWGRGALAPRAWLIAPAVLLAASLPLPARAACDFPPLQAQIEKLIDAETPAGRKFRSQVHDGWDSMSVLEDSIAPGWDDRIDECRFQVSEFLRKHGLASMH